MHLCTRPKSMQWISSDIPHTPRVHRAEVHLHLHRHHYHHHHHHRGTGSFIVNGFWRQFWWIERSVQPAPTAGLRKAPKDELGPCGSTLGHRFPCRRSRHRAELYTLLTRKVGPRVWARRVWYSGCVSEWTVWKSAYRVYVYSRDPYTHTHSCSTWKCEKFSSCVCQLRGKLIKKRLKIRAIIVAICGTAIVQNSVSVENGLSERENVRHTHLQRRKFN